MCSVAVTVPLRPPTKKMKKRKELDALAPPHAVSRRSSGKRSSQELLTDSSDERSEYWSVSTRNGRKCRSRRGRACPGLLKACGAFLACASVLATASLIWLFIDVRQQLTVLRTELDQVIAGNEAVPDALQRCHSLSRDLQNNQTIIFSHLSDLKLQISNFTKQVAGIQYGLQQVQEWFHAAPDLANVPKDIRALSSSVASFGSQIRDLGATINTLKETNARMQDMQTTMQQNISSIKHTVLELSNTTQKPQLLTTNETKIKTEELNAAILNLASNLTLVNETLSRMLQWAGDDQKKDHKILVSLQDTTQDVKSQLLSLQTQCAKLSDQESMLTSIKKLTDEVAEIRTTDAELNGKLKELEQSYTALKNSSNAMLTVISEIQDQRKEDRSKADGDSTTEAPHVAPDEENVLQRKSPTNEPKLAAVGRK